VHIEIVAQNGRCGHGIVLMRFGQLREPVVSLAVDHGPLFNPADLVLFGFYLEKASAVLQNLERLPVHHLGHALRDRGHAVV